MRNLLILLLVISCSCTSIDKAIKVATKNESNAAITQQAIHKAYPVVGAEFCADNYKPIYSEVIQGKEEVKEEVKEQAPVVVPCEDKQGNPVKQVVCPPCHNKTVYKTRTDTIRIENTAAKEASRLRVVEAVSIRDKAVEEKEAALSELKETKSDRNMSYVGNIIAILVIAGLMCLLFRRKTRI